MLVASMLALYLQSEIPCPIYLWLFLAYSMAILKSRFVSVQVKASHIRQSKFLSDKRPMLETLDYTIRIGYTIFFLYFDLYLYSTYAAHYIY